MSDALRQQHWLTAIGRGQPQSTHLLAATTSLQVAAAPSRRRLHAAGCSATSLGLHLLLSIKFIITLYYFQTLLLLEYITYFIHIYI